MKLNQLRDVVAIAEFGAIRPAARHLTIPQPLLSRNLSNLEKELGKKIFERRSEGMQPTVFGSIVIDGARKILGEVEQLNDAISEHHQSQSAKRKKPELKKRSIVPGGRDRASHIFIDLVFEIFRSYGRIMKVGDVMGQPIGLTSSRWQVMGSLKHNKASVSDIARYMGLQRQSIQRTIDLLRREGLVELIDNPKHRRSKLVALTPSGWKTIGEADNIRDDWIKRSTVGISTSELESAYTFLRRVRKRLGDRLE